jgi:hypothetical protein
MMIAMQTIASGRSLARCNNLLIEREPAVQIRMQVQRETKLTRKRNEKVPISVPKPL